MRWMLWGVVLGLFLAGCSSPLGGGMQDADGVLEEIQASDVVFGTDSVVKLDGGEKYDIWKNPGDAEPRMDIVARQCNPGEGCFLDKCTENKDCQSGWCVEHLGEGVCSKLCQEECPTGWACSQVAGTEPDLVYVCVSDHANLCRPCINGDGCKSAGTEDVCVDYGSKGAFCGGACELEGDCPWGFSCLTVETVDGIQLEQCVADAGVCPCTDKSIALGLWTPCEQANEWGQCSGKRVCTAEGLTECSATAPEQEVCNGLDDDCDEDVDEPDDVGGEYVNLCADGNPCTKDTCSGEGGCTYEKLSGVECLDGDACTAADHCEDGECVGDPVICDDENPCTDNVCQANGGCAYPPNEEPCDDEVPCTVADQCVAGECVGIELPCDCTSDDDCALLEDGDLCNGTLVCNTAELPFQCIVAPETVVACELPDGAHTLCLQPTCNPETGECTTLPDHEGFACEDGDLCTIGDTCGGGECESGSQLNCADDNPCTDDGCDSETGCVHEFNTVPCSDGDVCTAADVCNLGTCLSGEVTDCNDGNACTDDSCVPDAGCKHIPNDGQCDDGNPCTSGDHCGGGQCTFDEWLACDDGNPCTDDECSPDNGGCVFEVNTAPCDDQNVCTLNDHCHLGACLPGSAMVCDDNNVCTGDECDEEVGCQFPPNSAACSDGNECTVGDHCEQGACKWDQFADCNDSNVCTTDTCDAESGCNHVDNNAVCPGGTCSGGECLPGCDPVFYGTAGIGVNNGWTCNDVCGVGGGVSVDWNGSQEQEEYCHELHPGAEIFIKDPHNFSYPIWEVQHNRCKLNQDGQKGQNFAGNGTSEYGDQILCKCEKDCPCVPDCEGKDCGFDGCSGVCGTCLDNWSCVDDKCVCNPDCGGKQCGDDGCEGSCGNCPGGYYCNDESHCQSDKCLGKEPTVEHPGLPPTGWDWATLNDMFDYSAPGTLVIVAEVPPGAGSNVDGMIHLSNGDYSVLPNDSTGRVSRFTPVCGVVAISGNVFNGSLISLAETLDGRVVGPGKDGHIYRLSNDGTTELFWNANGCQAVANMPNGNILTLDHSDGVVREIDGNAGIHLNTMALSPPGTINIAMGPDGHVYTAEFNDGTIHKASPGQAFQVFSSKPTDGTIEGMTVLPNGDVLLGNLSHQNVERVDGATGEFKGEVAGGISGSTRSLQMDPNGFVYVAGSTLVYRLQFPEK